MQIMLYILQQLNNLYKVALMRPYKAIILLFIFIIQVSIYIYNKDEDTRDLVDGVRRVVRVFFFFYATGQVLKIVAFICPPAYYTFMFG